MSVTSYKHLEVWKKSRALVVRVYDVTSSFPKEEMYGLTTQLRRAAISIPSNIAEGNARRSTRDYIRFLNIAYGSIAEVETQLYIAMDLHYATQSQLQPLFNDYSELARMLNGLVTRLESKLEPSLNPAPRTLTPV